MAYYKIKKPPERTYPYKGLLRGDIGEYKAMYVQSQYFIHSLQNKQNVVQLRLPVIY